MWKWARRSAPWIAVFALGVIAARSDWVPSSLSGAALKETTVLRWLQQQDWAVRLYYTQLKPFFGIGRGGLFNPARKDALSPEQRDEIERLRAIGYVDGVTPAVDAAGVTVHDAERAWQGLNLETDGFEPEAVLRTMDGTELHRWNKTFVEALPESPAFEGQDGTTYWRRVKLFENGDLLANFEGHGLIKLDRHSNLLWAYEGPAHHDFEVLEDGDIWVLIRVAEIVPRISPDEPILHDFVALLDRNGVEKRRISLLEAIEKSAYQTLLVPARSGDIMHTNEIEVLDGRLAHAIPAFQAGRLLLSIRNMHALVVLDPENEEVVWALSGLWVAQHSALALENGNLLVFDNRGRGGRSRVVEFDPRTQEIAWVYGTGDDLFHSEVCGTNQRLPNGNTLITESTYGRAFEVTPDGAIVWEYFTEDRTGDDDELIATLFEVLRLGPDFPLDWLE